MRQISEQTFEELMQSLAVNVRNSTLEAAAVTAKMYGAPDEACRRILMLKKASSAGGAET